LQQHDSADLPVVTVTHHPTDPKIYAMLSSPPAKCQGSLSPSAVLADYWEALELAKRAILRCIAVGLDLDPSYLERLHDENNSSLRLLRYPKGTIQTGNRCKEHSDYGTITLLLTDGVVSGLEAFHEGQWIPVPHNEPAGALVVNAGSLLETWTHQAIPATLHRVAGPASMGSTSSPESLLDAVQRDRTSIAFFADPNQDAKASLLLQQQDKNKETTEKQMNVADYIQWRSGGDHNDGQRSGLAFTQEEKNRIQRSTDD
jgi:isopenicillin N synthase-like dioxygenase